MRITFNINTGSPEVHEIGFLKATMLLTSMIAGICFWVMTAIVLFDPTYR